MYKRRLTGIYRVTILLFTCIPLTQQNMKNHFLSFFDLKTTHMSGGDTRQKDVEQFKLLNKSNLIVNSLIDSFTLPQTESQSRKGIES